MARVSVVDIYSELLLARPPHPGEIVIKSLTMPLQPDQLEKPFDKHGTESYGGRIPWSGSSAGNYFAEKTF